MGVKHTYMCNLEMPFSRSLNKSKQSGQKWQNSAITNAFTSGCMIISKAKINVLKKYIIILRASSKILQKYVNFSL